MIPGLGRLPWRRERPTPVFWPGEFHGVSDSQTRLRGFHFTAGKYNAGDPGLNSGLERSFGEGIAYPLQFYWASLVVSDSKK